jgi:hypothetical protein
MSNSIKTSRLPSEEGFKQLKMVLLSFGKRSDILTVEICRAMEKMYGHIYKIEEMEEHLNELTKNSKLKKAGQTTAEAEGKYI